VARLLTLMSARDIRLERAAGTWDHGRMNTSDDPHRPLRSDHDPPGAGVPPPIERDDRDDEVDEASEESFPSSDPPSFGGQSLR